MREIELLPLFLSCTEMWFPRIRVLVSLELDCEDRAMKIYFSFFDKSNEDIFIIYLYNAKTTSSFLSTFFS